MSYENNENLFKLMQFEMVYIFLIWQKIKYKGFRKLITFPSKIEISAFDNTTFTHNNMFRDVIN